MYKIVKKERLNDVVELMEVHAPMVARKCEPGQFIILRVGEDGERIPLTIADYDREAETITIIYQIVGFSTRQLAKLNEGDEITDFVGPLGVPTDLHKSNHVVGIAGGVGSAPLYPQLKKLAEMGVDVDVIIGGREAQYVLWADKFKAFCKNVYVMTDDGSLGESGSIQTQKMMLEKYCRDNNFTIKEVYIDDGYSGLNFDRPAFKRLIADIESGKINLVITKDLSRLGRDYLQTGYYTEQYFPLHNVRYIAVNDGVDTLIDNNDIAPFKNILNDMYA